MNVIYSYAALLRAVVMSQESAHCWLSWELTSKFLNMMGLLLPGKLRVKVIKQEGAEMSDSILFTCLLAGLPLLYLVISHGWPHSILTLPAR